MGEAALVGALRRRVEKTVLVLPSGSYAQRVQAVKEAMYASPKCNPKTLL